MCPPTPIGPAVELNEDSTNEFVCKLLMKLKGGSSLPENVLSEVDPYQRKPSNLPGMWYFWSGTKKDTENGFWRATGEACEIYLTSVITGLRKTLQYHEGQAPHGQRTNWMMQEYTINDKDGIKPDPRGLYRVFLVDDSSSGQPPKSEVRFYREKIVDDGKRALAKTNQSPDPPSAMADQPQDPPSLLANRFPDQLLEDCVSRGDFISINDLDIPLSQTTSSADTSCRTMLSDDFFDSDALMRELGDDPVDHVIQQNLNLSAPAKPKEVVMHQTTIVPTGYLNVGLESKPSKGQTSKIDHTTQNKGGNHKKEGTSNSIDYTSASSSSSEGSSKEEKRNRAKKPKVMKYLCFLAF